MYVYRVLTLGTNWAGTPARRGWAGVIFFVAKKPRREAGFVFDLKSIVAKAFKTHS